VITVAIPEDLYAELAATLEHRVETAGFILVGLSETGHQTTLLARRIFWIREDGYELRETNRLKIAASAYVPALGLAAEDDAALLFFHSHPRSDAGPSSYDNDVDAGLKEPVQIRTNKNIYGSLILGGRIGAETFSGRVYRGDRPAAEVERLRIVGTRLRIMTKGAKDLDTERFDRQIRAFGTRGQAMLSELQVGIVGAGGTGSAVFEQLTRLGVGRIMVIDDDRLSESNLTRIHESSAAEVEEPKVAVAARAAERIGTGTDVEPIAAKITELDVAKMLRTCDVVFGCTDDNAGRAVLSRFAYWYLIPVIDTAFLVDTTDGSVRGLFGRVTTLIPGAPCLLCRGRIDHQQIAAEGLPDAERERLAAEGYVPGLGEPDPSVGPYTTLVGTMAVSELLDRLFGLSGDEHPPTELLLRLHDRTISAIERSPQEGHYCVTQAVLGRGDVEPFLEQLWAGSETA
jgi:molybdopterin/thiamine biosynthesis adenylyltransferase/proteasome lid subunit RPN8/RPN11